MIRNRIWQDSEIIRTIERGANKVRILFKTIWVLNSQIFGRMQNLFRIIISIHSQFLLN